jgi:hypothetical protein
MGQTLEIKKKFMFLKGEASAINEMNPRKKNDVVSLKELP